MSDDIAAFMFERTGVQKVGKYLDVSALQQKLIAGNIANVATPGYERRQIDFQSEFQRAAGNGSGLIGHTTHSGHIPFGDNPDREPDIEKARVSEGNLNSVDADQEISGLARNELTYTIAAQLLKRKFDGLRKAITSE